MDEFYPGLSSDTTSKTRFEQALSDPRLREAGVAVGSRALEHAGILKNDGDGGVRVSKRGVIKAAIRPTHTVRKATTGAVRGAREEIRGTAVGAAKQHASDTLSSRFGSTEIDHTSTVGTDWGVEGWQPEDQEPVKKGLKDRLRFGRGKQHEIPEVQLDAQDDEWSAISSDRGSSLPRF